MKKTERYQTPVREKYVGLNINDAATNYEIAMSELGGSKFFTIAFSWKKDWIALDKKEFAKFVKEVNKIYNSFKLDKEFK